MTRSEDASHLAGAAIRTVEGVRPDRLPRRNGLLSAWREDVTPAIRRRIEALEAIPGLRRRFGYPFPHNYVLLQAALRPERSVDDVLLGLRDRSKPLNDADEALNDWFDGLTLQLGGGERTEPLRQALAGWRRCRASGRNLQGVAWAEQAARAARQALGPAWSLPDCLARSAPDVIHAFLSIPEELSGLRRVRVFVAPEGVSLALRHLDDLGIFWPDRVDRLETAKPGLAAWDGSWPTIQLYPASADPDVVELLEDAVRTAGHIYEVRTGYRLFDRYLGLILDDRQQRSIRSGTRAAGVHR